VRHTITFRRKIVMCRFICIIYIIPLSHPQLLPLYHHRHRTHHQAVALAAAVIQTVAVVVVFVVVEKKKNWKKKKKVAPMISVQVYPVVVELSIWEGWMLVDRGEC